MPPPRSRSAIPDHSSRRMPAAGSPSCPLPRHQAQTGAGDHPGGADGKLPPGAHRDHPRGASCGPGPPEPWRRRPAHSRSTRKEASVSAGDFLSSLEPHRNPDGSWTSSPRMLLEALDPAHASQAVPERPGQAGGGRPSLLSEPGTGTHKGIQPAPVQNQLEPRHRPPAGEHGGDGGSQAEGHRSGVDAWSCSRLHTAVSSYQPLEPPGLEWGAEIGTSGRVTKLTTLGQGLTP